jgi:hypothetical protein
MSRVIPEGKLSRSLSASLKLTDLQKAQGLAKLLNKPSPVQVAIFVRRAVVHACECLVPLDVLLVPMQQLDYEAAAGRKSEDKISGLSHQAENSSSKAKINFVIELVHALCLVPETNKNVQLDTLGRILRLLATLCDSLFFVYP